MMNPRELDVLNILWKSEAPMMATDIVNAGEGLTQSTVTAVLRKLLNAKLVEVVGRKDTIGKPLLFGTTENFLKRFGLESIESLPNYNELLDRIRVIHSDGDSLYREFKIPDETEENATASNNDTEQINEQTEPEQPQDEE